MKDNRTSQPAREYDANVGKTIPFYDLIHAAILDLAEVASPAPAAWLDTGCGTGTLAEAALRRFPRTVFTLADPSDAMLEIAREKLAGCDRCRFLAAGTEAVHLLEQSFDIITAVLAHHYFPPDTRRAATANCFRLLREGGVYVTFETIMPCSPDGLEIGLETWRRAQLARGKSEADVDKHIKRYGTELLPIPAAAHLQLLADTGFAAAELFWASGLQAGFYAVKRSRQPG